MTQPACLVIGAGAGIGGNVAKKFPQEGYHSVLCRRSDEAGLNRLNITHQHRSVWTHELDLPTFSDTAWWNHES
jgi:short-subunit dehydrogenase|tara:strand:+ start:262 stop:483 length:222 start_codon:yes stop_codon:yes gene_type:complete